MRQPYPHRAAVWTAVALVTASILILGAKGSVAAPAVRTARGSRLSPPIVLHLATSNARQGLPLPARGLCPITLPTVTEFTGDTHMAVALSPGSSGHVQNSSGAKLNPAGAIYLPLVLRSHAPGPVILYFRADVALADPGDTIHLEWASVWATHAMVVHLLPTGQYGTSWTVDPTGSMDYTIPESWRNYEYFLLRVTDDAGLWAQAYLSIPLTCPDTWFFEPAPDECPAAPALYSPGAEQPFEHGVMLWVGEQDSIYVLSDNGVTRRWTVTVDYWEEGDPVDDPSIIPPSGYYQPVRGFGLVWRETPGVRDLLGWATALEQGYPTAVQRTSRWKYNDIYIRALDNGVWRLLPEGSGWEHIPAP